VGINQNPDLIPYDFLPSGPAELEEGFGTGGCHESYLRAFGEMSMSFFS
jgi:hypothetical protein